MNTGICVKCGKTIDRQWFYCPWCGCSRTEKNTEKAEQLRLEKVRAFIKEKHRLQVEKMENQLDELENELSVLVLSSEMHK